MHTAITEDDRVDRDLICANSKASHQQIQGVGWRPGPPTLLKLVKER